MLKSLNKVMYTQLWVCIHLINQAYVSISTHAGLRAAERHDPGRQYEGASGPHDHPVRARGKLFIVKHPANDQI